MDGEMILLKEEDSGAVVETDSVPVTESDTDEEEGLFCYRCGTFITTPRQRIEIDGSSEHRFTNPAGFMYQLICYRSASGCAQAGRYETDFSWFPDYGWRYAMCGGCFTHLGWHYTSSKHGGFYGIIQGRILPGR